MCIQTAWKVLWNPTLVSYDEDIRGADFSFVMLCFLLFYSLFASAVAAGEDPSVFPWNFFCFFFWCSERYISWVKLSHYILLLWQAQLVSWEGLTHNVKCLKPRECVASYLRTFYYGKKLPLCVERCEMLCNYFIFVQSISQMFWGTTEDQSLGSRAMVPLRGIYWGCRTGPTGT